MEAARVAAEERDVNRHGTASVFKTADAIAKRLGIENTAVIRVRAGISFALTEAVNEGHCGLLTDELASPPTT
jgi:hypothetical protein